MSLFLVSIFTGCKKDLREIQYASNNSMNAEAAISKPNILFIVGDDIGYEIPTCDGGKSYATPTLDLLAKNGMRFTQCHGSPLCAPSRITLLTGKYNFRNYTKWGYLSTDQKTIANMLGDAGYATCYAGKWQLDGGNTSIRTFGWQKYSVWLPFLLDSEYFEGSRYKSPKIYQDGGYLPDSLNYNKFSDDIFTSYLLNFIDSVHRLNKPFFVYDAMILCHAPFSPVPTDPQYATWDFAGQESNPKFFPEMVQYMDKKIGEILLHLKQTGLLNNTIIFYIGDNGTPPAITSQYDTILVPGGKGETTEPGTNVPLIVFWNGRILKHTVNTTFVNFTDFLPTLANVAGIPEPTTYGTLDGISFYPALSNGDTALLRKNIYNSFCIAPANHPWRKWVQDSTYKLYDTNVNKKNYTFVKIAKCEPDSNPLNNLTSGEQTIRNNFINILRSYDRQ